MLSREDIESLGFKQYVDLKDTFKSYRITINNKIFNLKVSIHRNNIVTISRVDSEFLYSTLFIGYIKNISELKVLLKQLGIDDKESNNRDS